MKRDPDNSPEVDAGDLAEMLAAKVSAELVLAVADAEVGSARAFIESRIVAVFGENLPPGADAALAKDFAVALRDAVTAAAWFDVVHDTLARAVGYEGDPGGGAALCRGLASAILFGAVSCADDPLADVVFRRFAASRAAFLGAPTVDAWFDAAVRATKETDDEPLPDDAA